MFVFSNEKDLDEFEISGSTYEPLGDIFYGGKVKSKKKSWYFFPRLYLDWLKMAFIQKGLMNLSFPRTDQPNYFPELDFLNFYVK